MTCYTSRSLKRRSCDLALGSRQPQTLCWCLSRNRISELGRVKVEAFGLGLPKKIFELGMDFFRCLNSYEGLFH